MDVGGHPYQVSKPINPYAPYPTYTPWKGFRITFSNKVATSGLSYIYGVIYYVPRGPYPYYVRKTGDDIFGTINTQNVQPRISGTYDLGSSSNRWKNLYLSGQIIGDKFQIKEVLVNTTSNRPSAGVQYRLFISTDEQIIYLDNGSEWIPLGAVYK